MGHKIDIMSFNPAEVATKLIMKDKSQVGGGTVSVEDAVKCCFRDVGHTDKTYGTFSHEFLAWFMGFISNKSLASRAKGTTKE